MLSERGRMKIDIRTVVFLSIIMFIYPKDRIKFFLSDVRDVVGVPNGHVDKRWLRTVQFEG